MIQGVVNN